MANVLGFVAEVRDKATKPLMDIHGAVSALRGNLAGLTGVIVRHQDQLKKFSLKSMITSVISGWVALKGVGAWGALTGPAREFQVSLENLKYVLGATQKQMAHFREVAFDIGAKTLYSAIDVTDAWYQLASYGLGKIAEKAITATLNFSTMSAGQVSLGESARFAGIMVNKLGLNMDAAFKNEHGKTITELDRAMDMLARTTQLTGFQIRDFPIAFNSMRTAVQDLNASLEDSLAIMGQFKTGGMMAAETGHSFASVARVMMGFSKKLQRIDIRRQIYDAMGSQSKRGRMREKFQLAPILKVFGSRGEFEKALIGSEGNLNRFIDFMSTVEKGLSKAGLRGVKKMGMVGMLFGGGQKAMQTYQMLEKMKWSVDRNIYSVNKWGQYLNEHGKIVKGVRKAHLLWAKDMKLTGFQALKAQSDAIRMSRGEAQKYSNAMAATTMGLKKLSSGVKETFMILIGEHVLPIMNKLIGVTYKFWSGLTQFVKSHPKITGFIIKLGIAITIIPIIVSLVSGLIAVFTFLAIKMVIIGVTIVGLVTKFKLLALFLGKGFSGILSMLTLRFSFLTGIIKIVTTWIMKLFTAIRMLATKGFVNLFGKTAMGKVVAGVGKAKTVISSFGKTVINFGKGLRTSMWAKFVKLFPRVAKAIGNITSKVGGLFQKLHKGFGIKLFEKFFGAFTWVFGIINIITGITGLWKKQVWFVRDGFLGIGKVIDTILEPFRNIITFVKKIIKFVKMFFDIMIKGGFYLEDFEVVGSEWTVALLKFFATDFGRFVRSVGILVDRLSQAFDKVKEIIGFVGEGMPELMKIGGGIGSLVGLAFGPGGALIGAAIGSAVGFLVAGILNAIKNWDGFKKKVVSLRDFIRDKIGDAFGKIADRMKKMAWGRAVLVVLKGIGTYAKDLFDYLMARVMFFVSIFKLAFHAVKLIFSVLTGTGDIDVLKKNFIIAFKEVGKAFVKMWKMSFKLIINAFHSAFDILGSLAGFIGETIMRRLGDSFGDLGRSLREGIKNIFKGKGISLQMFGEGALTAFDTVAETFSIIWNFARNILKVITKVANIFSLLFSLGKAIFSGDKTNVKPLIEKLKKAGVELYKSLKEAFAKAVHGIFFLLVKLPFRIAKMVYEVLAGIFTGLPVLMNKIEDGLGKVFKAIGSKMKKVLPAPIYHFFRIIFILIKAQIKFWWNVGKVIFSILGGVFVIISKIFKAFEPFFNVLRMFGRLIIDIFRGLGSIVFDSLSNLFGQLGTKEFWDKMWKDIKGVMSKGLGLIGINPDWDKFDEDVKKMATKFGAFTVGIFNAIAKGFKKAEKPVGDFFGGFAKFFEGVFSSVLGLLYGIIAKGYGILALSGKQEYREKQKTALAKQYQLGLARLTPEELAKEHGLKSKERDIMTGIKDITHIGEGKRSQMVINVGDIKGVTEEDIARVVKDVMDSSFPEWQKSFSGEIVVQSSGG